MGRLTHKQKAKIVRLWDRNKGITKIVRSLADDGCQISRLSVRRFLMRFQQSQSFQDMMDFTDSYMEKKDKLTAPHLRKKIYDIFGCDFSESKLKRLQEKLGWVQTGTKYCQLIREPNRVKRLEFTLKSMEEEENFDDVILTDDCSVHRESHTKLSFKR